MTQISIARPSVSVDRKHKVDRSRPQVLSIKRIGPADPVRFGRIGRHTAEWRAKKIGFAHDQELPQFNRSLKGGLQKQSERDTGHAGRCSDLRSSEVGARSDTK